MKKLPKAMESLLKDYRSGQSKAGARSNNRFTFQESWSLVRLLDKHSGLNDYLAVFDCFEDFVIFLDVDKFSRAEFYQIKTKDDEWKVKHLTDKKGKADSILQKLAKHFKKFPDVELSIYLVLNGKLQDISVIGSVGIPNEFCMADVEANELKEIISKVSSLKGKTATIFKTNSKIVNTSLSLDDDVRDGYVKGKLADYLTATFPDRAYQIQPIFDSLRAEIQTRSVYEKSISNVDELKKYKALSKHQISEFLTIGVDKTEKDDWAQIRQMLLASGASILLQKEIEQGYVDLIVIKNAGSPYLNILEQLVKQEIQKQIATSVTTVELLNAVYNNIASNHHASHFTEKVIKALILYEYQK